MLDGLRGEFSIAELCRREGIAESLYYSWSKEFLEAGKRRLAGDTARAATSSEATDLRREARQLKEVVAEQAVELHHSPVAVIHSPGATMAAWPTTVTECSQRLPSVEPTAEPVLLQLPGRRDFGGVVGGLLDLADDLHALDDMAEDDMLAVQPGRRHSGNEELRAIGARPGIGH